MLQIQRNQIQTHNAAVAEKHTELLLEEICQLKLNAADKEHRLKVVEQNLIVSQKSEEILELKFYETKMKLGAAEEQLKKLKENQDLQKQIQDIQKQELDEAKLKLSVFEERLKKQENDLSLQKQELEKTSTVIKRCLTMFIFKDYGVENFKKCLEMLDEEKHAKNVQANENKIQAQLAVVGTLFGESVALDLKTEFTERNQYKYRFRQFCKSMEAGRFYTSNLFGKEVYIRIPIKDECFREKLYVELVGSDTLAAAASDTESCRYSTSNVCMVSESDATIIFLYNRGWTVQNSTGALMHPERNDIVHHATFVKCFFFVNDLIHFASDGDIVIKLQKS